MLVDAVTERDSIAWISGSQDLHARREPELSQQLLAVLPRKAECAHIGDAEARDDRRDDRGVLLVEFAVRQRVLRPIHELGRGDPVAKVIADPVGYGVLRDD